MDMVVIWRGPLSLTKRWRFDTIFSLFKVSLFFLMFPPPSLPDPEGRPASQAASQTGCEDPHERMAPDRVSVPSEAGSTKKHSFCVFCCIDFAAEVLRFYGPAGHSVRRNRHAPERASLRVPRLSGVPRSLAGFLNSGPSLPGLPTTSPYPGHLCRSLRKTMQNLSMWYPWPLAASRP